MAGQTKGRDTMNLTQGNTGDKMSTKIELTPDDCGFTNGRAKISDARREYLRDYYRRNREKAREYQRQYNLTHKKKIRMERNRFVSNREQFKEAFTIRDIMHSPTEKALKIVNQILKGERLFVL